MTVCQLPIGRLTHCNREQAPSHILNCTRRQLLRLVLAQDQTTFFVDRDLAAWITVHAH